MKAFLSALSLVAVAIVAATPAAAQNWAPGSAKVGDVSIEIQQTPQYQAGNVKDKRIPRPRDWVEVEVEFEISDRVIEADYVDKVMVRYYIVIQGEKAAHMVSGDVNHVNVPTGEDVYSIAYIPPAMISKVKGKDGGMSPSNILAVGISIFINGVEIARGASGQPEGWWLNPSPSLVRESTGLLGKKDTPFSLLWIDRHADEEQTN